MEIMGWVCAGFMVFGIIFAIYEAIRKSETAARVNRNGTLVMAHIVNADARLYQPLKPNTYPDHATAKVIFTPDPTTTDDTHFRLQRCAERLQGYTAGDHSQEERALAGVKDLCGSCEQPVRLSDRFTSGLEVYAVAVDVFWKLLPDGYLTQSYIPCKVLVGPDGGARMVASPPAGWAPPSAAAAELTTQDSEAPSGQNSRRQMTALVEAMFAENYSRKYARSKLLEAGHPENEVKAVVDEAWRAHVNSQRLRGLLGVLFGAGMLAAGVMITTMSTRDGGDGTTRYTVMTGLIGCGIFTFFRGILRLIGGR